MIRNFQKDKVPQPKGYEALDLHQKFQESLCRNFVLEIGAGVGWHALGFAKQNPESFLVAVEHSKERYTKLEHRWKHHKTPVNLCPLHADAESVVTHLVHDQSLDKIFLLYPNPYPKASQKNKRWHWMPFFGELIKKLKEGAELEFATNEAFYAEEFLSTLSQEWKMKLVEERKINKTKDEFAPRTHFEKKYYLRGETLHLMIFKK